jgi:methylated-DNA-protein-cysteine methyltransferase-like protein
LRDEFVQVTHGQDEIYARIYDAIRRVPRGRVATYGQIAASIGLPRHARLVGRALRSLPEPSDVPWHRVVNSSGRVSRRPSESDRLQRLLLEAEGVVFGPTGRLALDDYRWEDPQDRPSGPLGDIEE